MAFKRHQMLGVNKSSQQLLEQKGRKSRGSCLMALCWILRKLLFLVMYHKQLLANKHKQLRRIEFFLSFEESKGGKGVFSFL